MILAFLLLASPRTIPCDGPVLPLKLLAYCKLQHVCVSSWQRGFRPVDFIYVSDKPLSELVRLYRQEVPNAKPYVRPPYVDSYESARQVGSVGQSIDILGGDLGEPAPAQVQVQISEGADSMMPPPKRSYKDAFPCKPPFPMIKLPFLRSAWTDEVHRMNPGHGMSPMVSSSDLEKSKANQELVYEAHLKIPRRIAMAKAIRWFGRHGYEHPESDCFVSAHKPDYRFAMLAFEYKGKTIGTRVIICHGKNPRLAIGPRATADQGHQEHAGLHQP